ncbi:XRE family transcriptional regulator [uncultured Shewanella sp.]|uniref:helix-turn-helix domain-containing protein n=1 Tax=uncultured Shewanella sp. TaxID=173975 RepID=UPI00262395EC|nr:XRE family transcriptional regulator [uncultured Shewanella sp.]
MMNPNQHLAKMLKFYRQQKHWSLDKTAQETGVSKAMLGQIERGESSPTVAKLWKIATGMQLSLSQLLEPEQLVEQVTNQHEHQANTSIHHTPIVRQANQLRRQQTQDDMLVATLFPFDPKLKFEVFELTLLAGFEKCSQAHAQGVIEHVLVIGGQMELFIEGNWQVLMTGDSIRFNADRSHGYRNVTQAPAVFHNIIYYP